MEEMRNELIMDLVMERFKTEDEAALNLIDSTILFVKNYGKMPQQGFTVQFTNFSGQQV